VLLAHDIVGTGAPVVLLHAGVADRRMWQPQLPPLGHRFRVISPDLRGFGDSPLPPEPYVDADDLADLLDHLGVVDAAVVGSSMGGRVALELATRHPDRVNSLVLLCPAFRGVPPSATVEAFDAEEDRLLESGDVAGAITLNVDTWLGPEATTEVRDQLTAMQRRAFEVQLAADRLDPAPARSEVVVDPAKVAVPTVIVSGAHDLDHFQTVAEVLAQQIGGAELVRLPWAGHLPSMERPDAVVTLLLDVLRHDPTVHAP
jgi:pimeloyl-ACP methyl ester carboxylesterase